MYRSVLCVFSLMRRGSGIPCGALLSCSRIMYYAAPSRLEVSAPDLLAIAYIRSSPRYRWVSRQIIVNTCIFYPKNSRNFAIYGLWCSRIRGDWLYSTVSSSLCSSSGNRIPLRTTRRCQTRPDLSHHILRWGVSVLITSS